MLHQQSWETMYGSQILSVPAVFINKVLLEHKHAICLLLSMPAFVMQRQSWVVVTGQYGLKYLVSGPL